MFIYDVYICLYSTFCESFVPIFCSWFSCCFHLTKDYPSASRPTFTDHSRRWWISRLNVWKPGLSLVEQPSSSILCHKCNILTPPKRIIKCWWSKIMKYDEIWRSCLMMFLLTLQKQHRVFECIGCSRLLCLDMFTTRYNLLCSMFWRPLLLVWAPFRKSSPTVWPGSRLMLPDVIRMTASIWKGIKIEELHHFLSQNHGI